MKRVINILKKRPDILIDEYRQNGISYLSDKDVMHEIENFSLEQSEDFFTKIIPEAIKKENPDEVENLIPLFAVVIVKNYYLNETIKQALNKISILKKILILIKFLENAQNPSVQNFIKYWLSRMSSKDIMECPRKNELFNTLLNLKEEHFFLPQRSNFFLTVWLNNNFLEKMDSAHTINKKIISLLLQEKKLEDQHGRLIVLENLNPLSQLNLITVMMEFIDRENVFNYLDTFSHIPHEHLQKINESWIDSQEKLNFVGKIQHAEIFLSKYILDNYLDKSFVVAYFLDGFQLLMKHKSNDTWKTHLKEMPKFVEALKNQLKTIVPENNFKMQFMESMGAYNMTKLYSIDTKNYEEENEHWSHSIDNFYELDTQYKNFMIEFRQEHNENHFFDQFNIQIKLHQYFGKLSFDAMFYREEENIENLKYFNAYISNLLAQTDNQIENVLNYIYNEDFREFLRITPCHYLVWKYGENYYCDSFVGHNMFNNTPKEFKNWLDIIHVLKLVNGVSEEDFLKYLVFIYFLNEDNTSHVWDNMLLMHPSENGNLGNNPFEKLRENILKNSRLRQVVSSEQKSAEKKKREVDFMKKNNLKKGENWLKLNEKS